MKVIGFIWLEEVLDKLDGKHNVQPSEVIQIFANRPVFRYVEKGHRPRENVYVAGGRTDAGRRLVVYFVDKEDRRALILSAREMSRSEHRRFGV